jgi:type I restriction enzyme R subunit
VSGRHWSSTGGRRPKRGRVRLVIEDTLDEGLPLVYTPELYTAKCSRLFEHVYERYA